MNDVTLETASELAMLRSLVSNLTLDLKLHKLQLLLQRAHSPEQPRISACQPNGGQRVHEAESSHLGSDYQEHAETNQEYIGANCSRKIYRQFLSQFLNMDISYLKAAARAGDPTARKAHKLLFDHCLES